MLEFGANGRNGILKLFPGLAETKGLKPIFTIQVEADDKVFPVKMP